MGVRRFVQALALVAAAMAVGPTLADDFQSPAGFRAQEIQSDGRSLDAGGRLPQVRLTAAQVDAIARGGAGAGTSGIAGIQTTVLSGDPSKPGPYSYEIRVPPHTRIAAHSHRDNRTALVVSGAWHFGYGEQADKNATQTLGPGGFYTEPAGQPHFAFTGDLPAVVYITGQGPTDTTYVNPAEAPSGN